MLAELDTLHDFRIQPQQLMYIPKCLIRGPDHARTTIADEETIVKRLSRTGETLIFSYTLNQRELTLTCDNPFSELQINLGNPGSDVDSTRAFSRSLQAADEQQPASLRKLGVRGDIFLQETDNGRQLTDPKTFLLDVLNIVSLLRKTLGNSREVVVDANAYAADTLIMTLACELVKDAFLRTIFHVAQGNDVNVWKQHIQELILEALKREYGSDKTADDFRWEVFVTDANLFDSAIYPVPASVSLDPDRIKLDATATGKVYRGHLCRAQVMILGAQNTQTTTPSVRFQVQEELDDGSVISEEFLMTQREVNYHLSKDSIRQLILSRSVYSSVHSSLDAHSVKLNKFSDRALRWIKRAGDWGQIMNCKRNHRVFVTQDLMAALYAFFEGVSCVFVRMRSKDSADMSTRTRRYCFTIYSH